MIDSNEALTEAVEIGRRLCSDAIWSGSECSWIGARTRTVSGLTEGYVLGGDLYEGTAGVGYFLAELYAATQEPIFRRTARGAITRSLGAIVKGGDRLGLFDGRTGVILVAKICQSLLELEVSLDLIVEEIAARALTAPAADIISGSAGILLALNFIIGQSASSAQNDALSAIGIKLAKQARRHRSGLSWAAANGVDHLTGYAHGASGIGAAFLLLSRRCEQQYFTEIAREAFLFEEGQFDPSSQNWADLRSHLSAERDGRAQSVAWCHGSAGILLARLYSEDPAIARLVASDIGAALLSTSRTARRMITFGGDQSLCHGSFGLIAILLIAARVLKDREVETLSFALLEQCYTLHRAEGRWLFFASPGEETPQLMTGVAGVGHVLLQAASLSSLPFLLDPAFEPLRTPVGTPILLP